MPKLNKTKYKCLEPRHSPRFPRPKVLVDKKAPEVSQPPFKKKRGRPRKDAHPPPQVHPSPQAHPPPQTDNTRLPAVSPKDPLLIDQVDIDLHFDQLQLDIPPSPNYDSSSFTVLSETHPELWDTIYQSYRQLPSDWQNNKIPKSRRIRKSADLQLEYLTANFLLPLCKKDSRSKDSRTHLEDSEENEIALAQERQLRHNLQLLAIAEAKILEISANSSANKVKEACEAANVRGDLVFPEEGSVKKSAVEESDKPDSPSEDVTLPETPLAKGKAKLRCLCFYCDQMTLLSDLTTLPFGADALEKVFLSLAKSEENVAKRMKEDCSRHLNYKICRRHVAAGKSRLSKNKEYCPDDAAIEMWKRRIEDDAQGRMMTFQEAKEEFSKSPMAVKRCFYCSRRCQHTISYACLSNSFESHKELLIKALAKGNKNVEAILKHRIQEEYSKGRIAICAAHYRRSSFISSSGASSRQLRLRKNEVPVGEDLINKVLCSSFTAFLGGIKESKETSFSAKVELDEWDRNEFGEKTPDTYQKLDLAQTLPNETKVVHRFCGHIGSSHFACLACSVFQRDYIGIMDIRTPGLSSASRKEKRPASAFILWLCDNKKDLRSKISEKSSRGDYMPMAKGFWNETSEETKMAYEEKRRQLWEEYSVRGAERAKAEGVVKQLKPAAIEVEGDRLLIDAQTLEHLCVVHNVCFSVAYLTERGYSPPRIVVPGYEKEALTYYEQMDSIKGLVETPKRKRVRKEKQESDGNTAYKWKSRKHRRAECSMVPNMDIQKWTTLFWNDHDYLNPRFQAALQGDNTRERTDFFGQRLLMKSSMPVLSGMTGGLTPASSIPFKTQTTARIHSKGFEKPFEHGFGSTVHAPATSGGMITFTPFHLWNPSGVSANVRDDRNSTRPFGHGMDGTIPYASDGRGPQEANLPIPTETHLSGLSTKKAVDGTVVQDPVNCLKKNSAPSTPPIAESFAIPGAFSCPFSMDSLMTTKPTQKQFEGVSVMPQEDQTPSRFLPISTVRQMKMDPESWRNIQQNSQTGGRRNPSVVPLGPLFSGVHNGSNIMSTSPVFPRYQPPAVSPRPVLPSPLLSRTSRYFKAYPVHVESPKDPSQSAVPRGAHVNCNRKYTFKPKSDLATPEKKSSSQPP